MAINHQGPRHVYQQVADRLRERIESGELAADRPIPSKRDLTAQFGVSGGSVDRATKILRDEGLIVTVPGRGLFVTKPEDRPKR